MKINQTKRLEDDLVIICYEGFHLKWSLFVALPCLIFWGFGIPLFAFFLLKRNKANLDSEENRQKLGFLYQRI